MTHPAKPRDALGEHLKQSLPVRIVGKDVFPPIPASGEMVHRAAKLEAKGPSHADQDTGKDALTQT